MREHLKATAEALGCDVPDLIRTAITAVWGTTAQPRQDTPLDT
jgi:hypothetical protein